MMPKINRIKITTRKAHMRSMNELAIENIIVRSRRSAFTAFTSFTTRAKRKTRMMRRNESLAPTGNRRPTIDSTTRKLSNRFHACSSPVKKLIFSASKRKRISMENQTAKVISQAVSSTSLWRPSMGPKAFLIFQSALTPRYIVLAMMATMQTALKVKLATNFSIGDSGASLLERGETASSVQADHLMPDSLHQGFSLSMVILAAARQLLSEKDFWRTSLSEGLGPMSESDMPRPARSALGRTNSRESTERSGIVGMSRSSTTIPSKLGMETS
mmetsp:Transcript_66440/g.155780  ORF Transcript_66440/g.155780 Transcript_66440/m.155780 type:complete len:273 (-) Transcript_66440:326-1144(-)